MKNKNLLEIKDLHVNVEDKEILHGVELNVGHDEVHVLMGPNGTRLWTAYSNRSQTG
mgnify:CR=1 FL=1